MWEIVAVAMNYWVRRKISNRVSTDPIFRRRFMERRRFFCPGIKWRIGWLLKTQHHRRSWHRACQPRDCSDISVRCGAIRSASSCGLGPPRQREEPVRYLDQRYSGPLLGHRTGI